MRLHKKLAVFSFAVIAGLGGFLSLIKYQRVIAEAVFAGRNQVTAALTGVTLNNSSVNVVTGTDISSETTALSPDTGAYTWTRNGSKYMALNMPFNLGATQTDFSGNGNNGTAFGTPTFTTSGCKVGGCMIFNGSNQAWDTGASTTTKITGPLTIAAWIKLNGVYSGTSQVIVGNTNSGGMGESYTFYYQDGKLKLSQSGTGVDAISTGTIVDNNWHHVVFTRSGSTGSWVLRYYIDGVLDSSTATGVNPGASPANLHIGRHGAYNGFYFNGTIDEVYVFPSALEGAQISQLRTDGLGTLQNSSDGVGGPTIIQSEETAAGQVWNLTVTPISTSGEVGTPTSSSNPAFITDSGSDITGSFGTLREDIDLDATLSVPSGSQAGLQWKVNGAPWTTLNLPFNSGASQTDISGNAYAVTLQGNAAYTDTGCKVGGCMTLDGNDDYAVIGSSSIFSSLTALTISVWVNATTGGAILTNHNNGSAWESVLLHTGQFTLNSANNTTNQKNLVYASVADGTWHHVAAVWTGTEMYVYRDGVLSAGPLANALTPWANTNQPFIGAYISVSTPPAIGEMAGKVDELQIYRRALSAEQVQQIYTDGLGSGLAFADGVGSPTSISLREHAYNQSWQAIAYEFFNTTGSIAGPGFIGSGTIGAAATTTITPTTPSGTQSRNITVQYTCSNPDNALRDFLVEYSTNGGGSYASASLVSTSSGTISGSSIYGATCNGSTQSFVWNSVANIVASGVLDSDVRVRMTGLINAAPAGDTGNFSVQNPYIFSSTTTINSGDTTYDGGEVLCSGATTLTINGTHSFTSLDLLNGCTLTHSETSSSVVNTMNLTVGDLTVDTGSSINVANRGYTASGNGTPAYTNGNTTSGGSGGVDMRTSSLIPSGGSHGGRGNGTAAIADVYDNVVSPSLPGGGGGGSVQCCSFGTSGGDGGGVIRITATGTVTLNGTIDASGQSAASYGGGGAGGTVYISAATIAGSGSISANGGNAPSAGGGGGGGIVALFYDTLTFDPDSILARAGSGTVGGGGAGTIYLKDNAAVAGDLIIDNGGSAYDSYESSTPLSMLTSVPAAINELVIRNYAEVTLPVMIPTITTLTMSGVGKLTHDGALSVGTVTLSTGAILNHLQTDTVTTRTLDLTVTDITIDATSSIDASERGYVGGSGNAPGRTNGNTTTGGSGGSSGSTASGGSHGGRGNGSSAIANGYDNVVNPTLPGGAGGGSLQCCSYGTNGGDGGGVIRITASGTMTIDGTIATNGQVPYRAGFVGNSYGGGGAGGSIYLSAATLSGTGSITANGADAPIGGGGGGGGVIAIFYDSSSFTTDNILAHGGSGTAGDGGAGTIFVKNNALAVGDLVIDGGGSVYDSAENASNLTQLSGVPTTFQNISVKNYAKALMPAFASVGTLLIDDNARLLLATLTSDPAVAVTTLTVTNTGIISHADTVAGSTYQLKLDVTNASIDATSSINLDKRGYTGSSGGPTNPAYTNGNTTTGGATNGAGGSYGGRGNGGGVQPAAYGSLTDPVLPGGGGGGTVQCCSFGTVGGDGGGSLILNVSGTLTVNGSIRANGQHPRRTDLAGEPDNVGGGGAGGGIQIITGAIAGSGSVMADGSDATLGGGGGGGGIIALYYQSGTLPTFSAKGGASTGGSGSSGSAGKIFYQNTPAVNGTFVVNNANTASSLTTPLFITGEPATYTFVDLSVLNLAVLTIDTPCSGTPAVTVIGSVDLSGGGAIQNNQEGSCTVSIAPVNITTTSLLGAVQNEAYSQILEASGGYAPYTWHCTDGAAAQVLCSTVLPPGLNMSSSGIISGSATTLGSYPFTVGIVDPDSGVAFSESFETSTVGACPVGWSCVGDAKTASTSDGQGCVVAGSVTGTKYLKAACDTTTGTATSGLYTLPTGVDHVAFRRAGGADAGSGLYVIRASDDVVLCSAEQGTDSDTFFDATCIGLSAYESVQVYLRVRDNQNSGWGKVYVDNIRFQNASNADLSLAPLTYFDEQSLSITVGNAPTAPTTLFVHSTDAQLGNGSPTGIDLSPVFSAIYNDPDTAETATDYELIVDDNSDFSSPLWSSGTLALGVACDQGFRCANINYAGSALSNATTYYWKIRFIDELGITGAFSATNSFTTNEVPSAPINLFSDDANAQAGAANPVGILATHPVFSAEFVDPDATDTATQAQVQVSENDDLTSPVWDSGTINIASCDQGTRCADIVYAGTVLVAETTYYWRIRFTDAAGSVSPWSEDPLSTNTFTMGSRGGSSTQFQLNQPPAPTAPAAPLAGATEVLGSTSVRYNWIDLSNNETGFRVLNADGQIVAQAEAGQTSAVETALAPNTVISGRRVLAFNAVGQSSSVELPQATTAAQVSRPVLDSRTGDSVRFIVEPAFTTFPGETAVRFELLVTSPAIGLSQPVTRTVTSEWIQQNDYTFTGISHDDVVQVRVITRNQEGLQNEPGIYEDVAELSRRFVVTMGVFKKGTEALPRPMITTDIISVRLALESVGTDSASSVILNMPLPKYIKYRPGTMIVDARAGLDRPNNGNVGNKNGISASWSRVNPGERHTLGFELEFDGEALRALKGTAGDGSQKLIAAALAAANPLINLQASVSFADSDVVYMSPVVTLEPDVASIPDELVPLEPEPDTIPEESPVPTPEQIVIIEEILKQEFGVKPLTPLPSQPQPQPTNSPTPSSPSPSLKTGNTSVSSDNGSFNVGVTNEYNLLGLTGEATVSADMITFAGTTTEPFTVVTLIFNGTVTVIAVSDANGVWQTFVNAEKLGIAPGQESVVTVEAIAAKGDLRSERVQVANVTVSRGNSGELTADFETTVSGNATLTAIREVQAEFVRVIEAQQPAIQTTLSVAAPIVVVSSVPLWGYLPYVPTMIYHFITYLLGLIGRKKKDKQRFYGVVYDSISKLPLPLAIVRIYSLVIPTGAEGSHPSQQKLVSTVVTDKLGRYESLLPPGNYRLEVSKPQYQFPSQIVNSASDGSFEHVYQTNIGLRMGESVVSIPDVPLDPVNAQRQWQVSGMFKKVWLAIQQVGQHLAVPVLLIGSLAGVAAVAAVPDKPFNWVLAVVYIGLLAAQIRLKPKLMKAWGVVYDLATNAVLPLTTIQLIDPAYNKVVTSRLTDYEGRFSFLPEPGTYVIKATKPGYEQIKEVVESPSGREPMAEQVNIGKPDQRIAGDVAMKSSEA